MNKDDQIATLKTELQKAIDERNAAWFQLEEAGIEINSLNQRESENKY